MRDAHPLIAVAAAAALVVAPALPVAAAPAATAVPLTNTAHLDFLLDRVDLPAVAGHSTYGSDPV